MFNSRAEAETANGEAAVGERGRIHDFVSAVRSSGVRRDAPTGALQSRGSGTGSVAAAAEAVGAAGFTVPARGGDGPAEHPAGLHPEAAADASSAEAVQSTGTGAASFEADEPAAVLADSGPVSPAVTADAGEFEAVSEAAPAVRDASDLQPHGVTDVEAVPAPVAFTEAVEMNREPAAVEASTEADPAVPPDVSAAAEAVPAVPPDVSPAPAPAVSGGASAGTPAAGVSAQAWGGRSAGRRGARAESDRVAAVNGILDAVRAAAAEAEISMKIEAEKRESAASGKRAGRPVEPAAETGRGQEKSAAALTGDVSPAATGTGGGLRRAAVDETGPEIRTGWTDPSASGTGAAAGDAPVPEIRVESRGPEAPETRPGPPEQRPPEAEPDAANDVADTAEPGVTIESRDKGMTEITVGTEMETGAGIETRSEAKPEVSGPVETPRERFQTDVVIAGAGAAGLAVAIRLMQRVAGHNEAVDAGRIQAEKLETPQVMVLEKAADAGNHVLSGAAVDPVSLRILFPDFEQRGAPVDAWVEHNPFYYLSAGAAFRVPVTPPGMGSRGCFIASLSRLTRWLAKEAEALGVQVAAGFSAVDWLADGGAVKGLRLADKGIDKHGRPRHNAIAGDEIEAKVTVLAEGVHGTLTRRAVKALRLDAEAMPQAAVLALKEVIEVPEERFPKGTALHTFGYPHDASTYAGGFLYAGPGRSVTVGLATGLDYRDPLLDPHDLFVRWKSHPFLQKWIGGGKVVEYGAKTIPEGGTYSVPRLAADGLMIVGDSGGLLNSIRLKGIHLAVQSGIDAGDAIFEAWKTSDFGRTALEAYPRAFFGGWAGREMKRVRNLHQCYHGGQFAFMAGIGLHTATLGLLPAGRLTIRDDADSLTPLTKRPSRTRPFAFTPDGLMPDKLSDVFLSGTVHEEDQPSHIRVLDPRVCAEKCKPEFDCPCTRFCPAQVYEWSEEEKRIRVNFTNCLHCQTCEVKDPLRNISWQLPEAGGGPKYKGM